jgi:hypothetical protein
MSLDNKQWIPLASVNSAITAVASPPFGLPRPKPALEVVDDLEGNRFRI